MTDTKQSTEVLEPRRPDEAVQESEGEESPPAAESTELKSEKPDVPDEPAVGKDARRLSVSLRDLLLGVVIVALVAGVGVLGWLYVGANRQLGALTRESADTTHAEKVALDYATNAAAMNFEDLAGWKDRLMAGTSPELTEKLSKAADQMEQILVPLQWNSTSKPLAAKVHSSAGGVYVVDSFVSVLTKTAQNPEPLQSTATYSVTVDSGNGWKITDVGGIGTAVQGR
jgi:hypothetical protein